MKSAWYVVAIAGMILSAGCLEPPAVERQDDLPTYICRRAPVAPLIDGKADDRAWLRADRARLVLSDGSGEPVQATTFRALWTDRHLYILFECVDDDVWAGYTRHDDKLYEQEVVEVFLNENGDRKAYVEIEVSPNNTTFDALILNPGGGKRFKGLLDYECEGLQTAVRVDGTPGTQRARGQGDDRGWTVELAVPFDQLILARNRPPLRGDRWCWNVYRIDRGGEKGEFTCWSPVRRPSFHTPERFGFLVFEK